MVYPRGDVILKTHRFSLPAYDQPDHVEELREQMDSNISFRCAH